MMESIVEVRNLSKKYKIYKKPYHRVIEWLTFGKVKLHEEFWALKDIGFELKKGECLGIVGTNGAGKSTLLKILSGAIWPTHGKFQVKGKMVSLLELGTGFHPELSGIDNIFNSGKLLGFSNDYLSEKLNDIVEFSELGDFINQPVKTYSSGMYVRLAFSMYANLEPDVYVVDEALSVGDIFFQQKCFDFLRKLMDKGTAIILVTHDMQTVLKFCDKVMILKDGVTYKEGPPVDMVNLYYTLHTGLRNNDMESIRLEINKSDVEQFSVPIESSASIINATGMRRGNGDLKILGASIYDLQGKQITSCYTGDQINLILYAEAQKDITDLTFSFQFSDRFNTVVFGQNAYMITKNIISAQKGERFQASFEINMNLFQGLYTLAVGSTHCQTEIANIIYDWIEGCLTLEILKPEWRTFHGIAYMNSQFSVKRC